MNKEQKLMILAAIAGLSAVGLLILLRRRHRDGEEGFGDDGGIQGINEDPQELAASASETVVVITVPQYCVGAIIGRGGENIRKLKKEAGVRIDFEREINGEDTKTQDRKLQIRGDREKVQNAEIRINQFISEIPKVIESEILIPNALCGRIIGKGGSTIRELSSVSGAKITVDRNEYRPLEGMRKVSLKGTLQQIEFAKGLIEEKVEQFKGSKIPAKRRAKNRSPSPASRQKIPVSKIPATKDFVRVFVSAFDIPSHFYIQLVTELSHKLDELSAEMTSYYGNPELSRDEKPPSEVAPGEVFCAPFELDDLWYRASVIEVNSEEKTAVMYYIDYGDTGTVELDELRRPKPEFLQLEAQAVECFLADVQPTDGKWSEEAIDRFDDLSHCAKWSELMARVVKFQEIDGERIPCLELIDTKQEVEVNIAQALIKEGYAVDTAASNEFQLQPIQEEFIAEAPNNNVVNLAPPILSSQLKESNQQVADILNYGENENNKVTESEFVNDHLITNDAIIEENEGVFAEPGSFPDTRESPGMAPFSQPGQVLEESKGELDGRIQGSYDRNHSNRSSVEIASISSSSTEDTVVHVGGKAQHDSKTTEAGQVVNENLQGVEKSSSGDEAVKIANPDASPPGEGRSETITEVKGQVAEVKETEVRDESSVEDLQDNSAVGMVGDADKELVGQYENLDSNDSGVDLETVNFDSNPKRSVAEEVSRWMERSYEEACPLETIPEGTPIGSSEAFVSTMTSSMTSSTEADNVVDHVPGSHQKYRFQESMELAKENPVMLSDDEDSMTYFSARSELTVASDNDTLSFTSAPDTPTNNSEFQFPSRDVSTLDYDIITTPVGSDDEKLVPDVDTTPVAVKSTPLAAASSMTEQVATPGSSTAPKYRIKFIDESGKQGPKVLSASMENVSSSGRDRLDANPQRVGKLSTSTPQFGELQTSQSRFGGSGSFFGKETSI